MSGDSILSLRKNAFLAGHKTYLDLKPCKVCGNKEKYVSSYQCVSCSVNKLKNEKLMENYRTVEKQRDKLKRWRRENPDKYKQQGQTPKAKAQACAKASKYRARKRNQALANANNHIITSIYAECRRLSEETGIPHEVDHIVPISLGGIHHETNLQIITRTENRMKGNRYSG
jgi:5-methylcytosine-specific restriction endonuclease McrA